MAHYKVCWDASNKEAHVKLFSEATPDNCTEIGTFKYVQNNTSYSMYNHVKNIMYCFGITNMSIIKIIWDEAPKVLGITVTPNIMKLAMHTKKDLKVVFNPKNPKDTGLIFVSNDTTVVTTTNKGTVHAVGIGSTAVVVTSTDGDFSNSCMITVVG